MNTVRCLAVALEVAMLTSLDPINLVSYSEMVE